MANSLSDFNLSSTALWIYSLPAITCFNVFLSDLSISGLWPGNLIHLFTDSFHWTLAFHSQSVHNFQWLHWTHVCPHGYQFCHLRLQFISQSPKILITFFVHQYITVSIQWPFSLPWLYSSFLVWKHFVVSLSHGTKSFSLTKCNLGYFFNFFCIFNCAPYLSLSSNQLRFDLISSAGTEFWQLFIAICIPVCTQTICIQIILIHLICLIFWGFFSEFLLHLWQINLNFRNAVFDVILMKSDVRGCFC